MDFNLWEITALVVLAIIVFGPEKLPELARKTARVVSYLRRIGNDARGQLRKELGDDFADISLADLNPRTFVSKHLLSGEDVEDLRQIRDEALASGTLVRDTLEDARGAGSGEAGAPAPGEAQVLDEQRTEASGPVPFDPEAT